MFSSTYKIKIEGKDVKRFIKKLYSNNIYFNDIEMYDKYAYVEVDKSNYEKLKQIKTIYKIEIVKLYGIIRIIDFIKIYSLFLIILSIGLLYLIFLSNIIFKVEVIHSKKEIRDLLYKELKYYNLDKYHFVKSYKEKEKIEEYILNNHKDKLEWLEIERIGTKYEVRVEERIIKKENDKLDVQNIVAKKNGIITKIEASKGEIVKKVGDYVKKGDIIISGTIKKDDVIKGKVAASGNVYAEVWYKTIVDMPYYYKNSTKTGRKRKVLKIKFLDKDIYIFGFKKYKFYDERKILYLKSRILPIGFSYSLERELNVEEYLYSPEEAVNTAIEYASKKLQKNLGENESIISKTVLNSNENENYITVEIFYKVNENITDTSDIVDEQMEKSN